MTMRDTTREEKADVLAACVETTQAFTANEAREALETFWDVFLAVSQDRGKINSHIRESLSRET